MGRAELVGTEEWARYSKRAGKQVSLLEGAGFSVQFRWDNHGYWDIPRFVLYLFVTCIGFQEIYSLQQLI